MIEAMACGTPVLAFRCGSVPEIVEDGLTGAIVDTMEEAIAALPRVIALDRKKVRQRFEQRFSATRMAKDYVDVYRSLLASSQSTAARATILRLAAGRRSAPTPEAVRLLRQNPTATPVEEVPETPFYIPGTGSSTRPRRTLKQGDCFAVLDSYADIGASPGGPDGIFFCDTRYLSQLELLLNGRQPLLLGSNVRDDNSILTVDLTNPDIYLDRKLVQPKDALHIVRTLFLWNGTAYQRLRVQNHGDRPFDVQLSLAFASDFADLFEVRGLRRARRGTAPSVAVGNAEVTLNYHGLDGIRRRTTILFDPAPAQLSSSVASYAFELAAARIPFDLRGGDMRPRRRGDRRPAVPQGPARGVPTSARPPAAAWPRSPARTRFSTRWCAARWPTSRC